ncbi:MAG: hypothetical protein KDK36_16890 [Leptospiraceae bacterium]|nr:hypothetical protein [Leptospiraceae bacterium]
MKILIGLFFIFLVFSCKEEKEDNTALLALVVLSRSTTSTYTANTTFTCSTSNPAFSTLADAGTTNNCAKSGCHNSTSKQQGLDITSYSSVLAKVNSGDPPNSLLYQKITSGSMSSNSTEAITKAFYCWIKGGANP